MTDFDILPLQTEVEQQLKQLNGKHTRRDIARIAQSVAKPYGIDELLVPYLVDHLTATCPPRHDPVEADYGFELGGVVFDQPDTIDALWGNGEEVLAAVGEPTILYSATGIGKTTIAQRVALAAIGIGDPTVLGYDVKQIEGRVLYIAADRPRQAMRSIRRMVTEQDRDILDQRWRWERHRRIRITPDNPNVLLDAAEAAEATLLIIDSLKDIVPGSSTEEGGAAYNNAVQTCVANDVDAMPMHHARKATSEGRASLKLDDVYGSTWITAGAGSVIALNGTPGQGIITLNQLKMPSEQVGPFDINIDYPTGTLTTIGRRDLVKRIREKGSITTIEAVRYMTGKNNPSEAEKKSISRKLVRLEKDGEIVGTRSGGQMTIWIPRVSIGGTT
jgi:replicative DNA helicase